MLRDSGPCTTDMIFILKRCMPILLTGQVVQKNEEFFLKNKQGNLEFSLLAEGMRKLGLLWLLVQNGTLQNGSVLFWDEPETNLNPKMYGVLVDILIELQRQGVQIFLATHDFLILKEFDLQRYKIPSITYHSCFRDDRSALKVSYSDEYLQIHPNCIAEAFSDLYDREIQRSINNIKTI